MKISRKKFVILFMIFALVFQLATNSLYLSETRLFPGNGESFFVTGSAEGWKNVIGAVLLPVKAVLIGPLIPYINFLRQEPDTPPPFFLIGFALYWSLLALAVHYIVSKIKRSVSKQKF